MFCHNNISLVIILFRLILTMNSLRVVNIMGNNLTKDLCIHSSPLRFVYIYSTAKKTILFSETKNVGF